MGFRYWVVACELCHLSCYGAVFEKFHAPARVVVPHVGNNIVGALLAAAGGIHSHLVVAVVAGTFVSPAHVGAINVEHCIATRCSVHTLLAAPPGAAHGCGVVLIEAVAILIVELGVGVSGDDVCGPVFHYLKEMAGIIEPVGGEVGFFEVSTASGGNVHKDENHLVLRHEGEVLLKPAEGLLGKIAYIVDADTGKEIVVEEHIVCISAVH